LDQISSELTTELGNLGERTSGYHHRESRGHLDRDGFRPYERDRNRYEPRNSSCLDIVRDLWGYMKDMSENLLTCQNEHRKTEHKVKKLERENQSYKNLYMNFKEKERMRESIREIDENTGIPEALTSEMEIDSDERRLRPQDLIVNTMGSGDGDSDIDKQLEAEMQRSQQLKKNLIDVLETYDQVSVQRKSRNSVGKNSSHSSLKRAPVDQGYQKPRESRDFREQPYQNERISETRSSFGPGYPRQSGGRNTGMAPVMEYYESERPQEGWRDMHNNELHNVMNNYYDDDSVKGREREREIYIEEPMDHYQPNKEYIIKRPSRSSLQNTSSPPVERFSDKFDSHDPRTVQIEDPSNVKISPRFGEDQLHHQAMAMKRWPNINQMRRELEGTLDRDRILEVYSDGKDYQGPKPSLAWKKTP